MKKFSWLIKQGKTIMAQGEMLSENLGQVILWVVDSALIHEYEDCDYFEVKAL